jgi:type IV secretion system protein VirD4
MCRAVCARTCHAPVAYHHGMSTNTFTSDFMRDVARGVTARPLTQQTPPQARWQPVESILRSSRLIYDVRTPGDRIIIGALGDRLIGVSDNRHMMTVAGSRAGKSLMLKANLAHYRGSVLAFDPKGELARLTAQRRAALGQRVHILDPFGLMPERLAPLRKSFNPLSLLRADSRTLIEDAGLIADALVIAAGKDPHWDESARNFIEGVMLHVATDPSFDGQRSLIAVRTVIRDALLLDNPDDPDAPYRHEVGMLRNAARLERDPATADVANAIEGAARDFYEKPSNERASVLSTVRRHTKFLDYGAMRSVLAGHDFDLADLKRLPEGTTIYLCLPANRMGLCSRWLRVFVNLLLDAMERERAKPAAPVLVCLDEFPVLGHMRQLEDAAGQIASFGVKLWVFLQDWGQGKALYKERWETFAGNAGVMQFFGVNDLTTMDYVSRRLGKTIVMATRESEVGRTQRADGLSGQTESLELHDLLTPEEVGRQFARDDRLKRQLVILPGYHPLILQRVEYFDTASPVHYAFAGLFADD